MIDYDFIEIGTSDFDTCIQSCQPEERGLSIEPLKVYLDKLPDKPNVTKINCAISLDGTAYKDKIYWIHPDDLGKNGLPLYLKGCNKIGEPHLQHLTDRVKNTNAVVRATEINMVPISSIFSDYNVGRVKLLKLDTEGADCAILKSMISVLETREKEYYPDEIFFEANKLTPEEIILETIEIYKGFGYKMAQRTYQNVRLLKVK